MVSTKGLEELEMEVVVASQLLHTRGQLAAASGEDSLSCWTSSAALSVCTLLNSSAGLFS